MLQSIQQHKGLNPTTKRTLNFAVRLYFHGARKAAVLPPGICTQGFAFAQACTSISAYCAMRCW